MRAAQRVSRYMEAHLSPSVPSRILLGAAAVPSSPISLRIMFAGKIDRSYTIETPAGLLRAFQGGSRTRRRELRQEQTYRPMQYESSSHRMSCMYERLQQRCNSLSLVHRRAYQHQVPLVTPGTSLTKLASPVQLFNTQWWKFHH